MNKSRIIDGRSYPHEVLEHYRFRTIELLKEGKKVNDIAHFFGVNRVSVSRWVIAYKRNGKKALLSKKAPGPSYKLTEKEMKEMIKFLYDDATIYGFETPLWTCQRLRQIIQTKVGKKTSFNEHYALVEKMGNDKSKT